MMRFLKFFPFGCKLLRQTGIRTNLHAIVFVDFASITLRYFIDKGYRYFYEYKDYLFIHLLLFLNNFQVTAYSPTSRPLGCPVSEENGTFYASFQPEEAGEWKIHVTYDGQDIEHSPFKCMVFNPRAIFVSISYFRVPLYSTM